MIIIDCGNYAPRETLDGITPRLRPSIGRKPNVFSEDIDKTRSPSTETKPVGVGFSRVHENIRLYSLPRQLALTINKVKMLLYKRSFSKEAKPMGDTRQGML